jgi:SAM-dependent methyltransferase
MTGALQCTECDSAYAIARGVPRMNIAIEMNGLERTQQTFSYEWNAHRGGELEETDTLWGLTLDDDWAYFREATNFSEGDLAGKVVLDAGCGSGRLTRQMAEHGADVVIGVDMTDAVDGAFDKVRALPNVHIIQGNIFELPLREQAFDLVWSNGVIHHTPDAKGAHAALTRMVRPGGLMYVWVYAKRFNPFRFTKDVLDLLRVTRLPEPILMRIAKVFAHVSLRVLGVWRGIRSVKALRPRTRWGERSIRHRTVDELYLTWFDALSPEFDSRHREDEVIGWYRRHGFTDIGTIEEPKVGVRGVAPAATV